MIATKKVAFYTLGCKLNFSETSTIARDFQNEGFERVDFSDVADIYVINTCSVTENADKRFKTIVKQALQVNADAFIIAIGCYAQLQPQELADVYGVDLVLGATEKFKITDYRDPTCSPKSPLYMCGVYEYKADNILRIRNRHWHRFITFTVVYFIFCHVPCLTTSKSCIHCGQNTVWCCLN